LFIFYYVFIASLLEIGAHDIAALQEQGKKRSLAVVSVFSEIAVGTVTVLRCLYFSGSIEALYLFLVSEEVLIFLLISFSHLILLPLSAVFHRIQVALGVDQDGVRGGAGG
jgi:hypothetical protein